MELLLERTELTRSRATVAQECFWYMRRADPDPDASSYMMTVPLALVGPLDRAALTAAVEATISRHTVFGCALREEGGKLYEIAGAGPRFELEHEDRSGVPESARDGEIARLERELGAAIDLAAGRNVRGRLVRFAPEHHALVLRIDHAVADAASVFMLKRELVRAYGRGGAVDGPPALQHLDYAAALDRFAASPAGAACRSWWQSYLAGARPNALPVAHPRAEHDARRAAAPLGIISGAMLPTLSVEVPPALRETIGRVAQDEGVPASLVYLAAYVWWLREATGSDEACIEYLHNPRGEHHVEQLQGVVVTWMIVRCRSAGCATLRDAIRALKDELPAAMAHAPVPDYYDIVPREIRGVTFNYIPMEFGQRPVKSGELSFEHWRRPFPLYHRHWELMLFVTDSSQRGFVHFTGNSRLFRAETIDALARRYVQLLADLA